jgi:hypothetical protein
VDKGLSGHRCSSQSESGSDSIDRAAAIVDYESVRGNPNCAAEIDRLEPVQFGLTV